MSEPANTNSRYDIRWRALSRIFRYNKLCNLSAPKIIIQNEVDLVQKSVNEMVPEDVIYIATNYATFAGNMNEE